MKSIRILAVAMCLPPVGTALAADRAAVDCTGASNPARMVAGCTRLLQRRGLSARFVAMILRNRGLGYDRGGDVNSAFADFDAAARADPTFAPAFESRALIYKMANDLDHALADLDTAIRLDPSLATPYMNRGLVWMRKGDLGRALRDLDVAVSRDGTNMAAYANRAAARNANGDQAGALADIEVVARSAPDNPQVAALRDQLAREIEGQSGPHGAPAGSTPSPATGRDIDEANATRARITALFNEGAFQEALRVASDFEAQAKARFGSGAFDYAFALESKGIALGGVGRFQDQAQSYETALAIAEKQTRPLPAFLVEVKQNLAQAYTALSRFAEADRLMDDVIPAIAKSDGPDSDDLANALNTQAIIDLRLARYAVAETRETRAVAIWTKLSSGRLAGGLDLLGSIDESTNRDPQAEAFYQRALALKTERLGADSSDVAMTLGNLGGLYVHAGRYAEAEAAQRRAVAIFEKSGGPTSPDLAHALTELAGTFSEERHDRDAEAALNRALVIQEKAFGPDNENVAYTLEHLADVLERGQRASEAEALYNRVLAIDQKTFGSEHPFVSVVLNNLANSLSDQGRGAEAETLYRRALTIDEKLKGKDDPETMGTIVNLANCAVAAGRLNDAEALYKRALSIADKSGKVKPEPLNNALFGYALLLKRNGRSEAAEAMAARALAQAKASFGPDHVRVSDDLALVAALDGEQGRWRDALVHWTQASEIAVKIKRIEGFGPGANDASRLVGRASVGFVDAAWHVAATEPAKAAALAEAAFAAAQRAGSTLAGTALTQMAVRFGAGTSAIAAAVRRQQDLSAQAKALDTKLTAALGAANGTLDEQQITALRTRITDTTVDLAKVQHEIASAYPKYAELSDPAPLDLAETRALLGPDEALINWLVLDKESYVFALTREGSTWRRLDIDDKGLQSAVARLRSGLDLNAVTIGMAARKPAKDVLFDLAAAQVLYAGLIGPVADVVAGKHEWDVVPTGALTSLPLDVLVTKAPDHPASAPDDSFYRDAAWLAREHAISVLPSVSALRSLRVYAKASRATRPLVGFADPVFDAAQIVASNDPAAPIDRRQRGIVKSYRSYFRGGAVDLDALRSGLPALPETAAELHEVAHELAAPDADLRTGAAATVTAVKALPLDRYRVVYFATHGLVAGDVDGLDEPALALSIPAKPTAEDDGLLKASDVTQLTLDADWVVLSACNTAVGGTPGAEGLSGLARAFFYAGARALLVSHWPVESHAAVALTTQSFHAMAGDPKLGRSEALRRSMLALIEKGGENAYPAIWAPFSVVGEGERR